MSSHKRDHVRACACVYVTILKCVAVCRSVLQRVATCCSDMCDMSSHKRDPCACMYVRVGGSAKEGGKERERERTRAFEGEGLGKREQNLESHAH
mmetsp:Transcript_30264/g.48849  ORF Transcript_30264/g.48849 Transcript_30264/m.48849 type:complete len:95 (+) Transcript_30264:634-918(+)